MSIDHAWAPVPFYGRTIYMSRDAYRVTGIRRSFTPREATDVARGLGGRLPTPRELDARWEAAQLHNLPQPNRAWLSMGIDVADAAHSAAVDATIPAGYEGIVGNPGKVWVDKARSIADGSSLPAGFRYDPLYGWHWGRTWPVGHYIAPLWPAVTPGLFVIQRPWDSSHVNHRDYSMVGIFTRDEDDTDPSPDSEPATPRPSLPGEHSSRARAYQRWLNVHGYKDNEGKELVEDGRHGPRTEYASRRWRSDKPTPVNGIRPYPLIRASKYTPADRKLGDVHIITGHSIQCPARPGFARSNAKAFALPQAKNASIHWWVGPDEIIQGLEEKSLAWGAKSGPERHAQLYAIHVEHTGYTADPSRGQVQTDWLGEGLAVVQHSARLYAEIAQRWDLLPEIMTPQRMAAWRDAIRKRDMKTAWALRGLNIHKDWTVAYRVAGGNQDIGGWPYAVWLDLIHNEMR